MAATRADEIYERHVRLLPPTERLRLAARIVQELAQAPGASDGSAELSLLELHGLGKEIWEGIDPDEYVQALRGEWDHRP